MSSKPEQLVAAKVVTAEPGVARPAATKLPRDELNTLAADYGLNPDRLATRDEVVEALAARKKLIQTLDRDAMLDIVRWGRRPVAATASREQLALEIARVKKMTFDGLGPAALRTLALLRGCRCDAEDSPKTLLKRLRRQESLAARLDRNRRAVVGSVVAKLVGGDDGGAEPSAEPYRYLAPGDKARPAAIVPPPPARLRDEIEERGLIGGLADRVRRGADSYVNVKLDEIEARIDRKLDEIDRRLGEWRDKEVANRVRIIKITLWASVIVSVVSLIYAYVTRQVF